MKEIIKIKNISNSEYLDILRGIRTIINNEFKERMSKGDDLNEVFDFYGAELNHIRQVNPTYYFGSTSYYLDDDTLCDLIDTAPDWEFCEVYGLLDELVERAEIDLNYNSDHWESDIDKAIEKLRKGD